MRFSPGLAAVLSTAAFIQSCTAASQDFGYYYRLQQDRSQGLEDAEIESQANTSSSSYQYLTAKTKPYLIESWPDVHFDTGEFYSGSIPIDESNPNRTLFFIFKPIESGSSKDLTIWLNGGPGCSSLNGFFQENGPILWQPGTYHPMKNPYSWSKYTNMIWVEQPVGTGFSEGEIEAKNEVDVAKDFIGFFKNFEKLFGIQNYRIFATGESYAGRYVPYISAEMLNQNDTQYFDMQGNVIYDPCIGEFLRVGSEIPTYDFVKANNQILNLPDSVMAELEQKHVSCGYQSYIEKYMQFPPPHHQPDKGVYGYGAKCDVFDDYLEAAYQVNPCFNIYHITDYCPALIDPLGNPQGAFKGGYYFNRTDVKTALHAPEGIDWSVCSAENVFLGGKKLAGPEGENDRSPDPIQGVLPQVIEATQRVLVSNGDWDGLLLTNGTLLSIQNMTWGGKLGFQEAPTEDFYVPYGPSLKHPKASPQGVMGKQHYERGLMWVESYQAGHMQPQYQPLAALLHLQWMLGMIDSFDPPS